MVEPGTAISVSARSCRLFDVYGIACFFLEELNFSMLHYLLEVRDLPIGPSVLRTTDGRE